MAEIIYIKTPQVLTISGEYSGGDQNWYRRYFQKMAGCGPTNGSNLIWYMANTREGCSDLSSHDGTTKEGFVKLMEDVWCFIRPGIKGVHTTRRFAEGVEKYGTQKGISLTCSVLDIPPHKERQIDLDQMASFIMEELGQDRPVAFLNLDNGKVKNLDRWHWVTLVGYDPDTHNAVMYDEGKQSNVDMALWLKTSKEGGGFAAIRAK